MGPERLTVATELLAIAVERWGALDGDPILLLHGFPFDPRSFDKVAPRLAEAGMRVIVPYLRGYGPTRFRSPETMRSGQQTALADDARALLDAMQIERALVGGFDWGGRAACILALLWPERVRGLLAVGGYLVQDLSDPTRPAPGALEQAVWHQYYFASERGRRALAERPRDICLHLRKTWSPAVDEAVFAATAESFANPDFAAVAQHSYAHRIGAMPGDPRYAGLDRQLLPPGPVMVPSYVVTGEAGALSGGRVPGSDARFTNLVGHRRAAGAGHDPAAETPDDFVSAVLELRAATS